MKSQFSLIAGVALLPFTVQAQEPDSQQKCLLEALQRMPEGATVGEVRRACATPESSGAEVRQAIVAAEIPEPTPPEEGNTWKLTTYRMNYILPLSYDQHRPSSAPFSQDVDEADDRSQKVETKYQISFKFPVWPEAIGGKGSVYAAYTQRSFWQMYNTEASRPFRETNYEPEVWYQYPMDMNVLGWKLTNARVGINHQSNGRGQAYSRSWSRVMGGLEFEHGAYRAELRPWWRIKEDPKTDDNPDINHYLGNFDLAVGRDIGDHFIGVTLRNNLETSHNRGAIQLDWTFPLFHFTAMRGYVQWFNGYGESLIDYNVRQNTIGAGIQLVDW